MTGPEGQIFGPMADAYAFALGGALLFALTLSPVLCRIFMSNIKGAHDNFLVRGLKQFYLRQLNLGLRFRWLALAGFGGLIVATVVALPFLGREFMPALEEGNVYIRGTFPVKVSLEEVARQARTRASCSASFPRFARRCRSRADPTTAPTRRASTTPSFWCH